LLIAISTVLRLCFHGENLAVRSGFITEKWKAAFYLPPARLAEERPWGRTALLFVIRIFPVFSLSGEGIRGSDYRTVDEQEGDRF